MAALGTAGSGSAAVSARPIANAGETPAVTQAGRPGPLHVQPGGLSPSGSLSSRPDLTNSAPTSLSLLLCPRYLGKWEQRKDTILSLQRWTNLATHALPGACELQRKQHERVLYRATTGVGFLCKSLGRVSDVQGSPVLPSLSAPQPRPPGGHADGLLPKLLHDLPDPGQVGLAEREVALRGAHVVADHAVLGGGGEALGLGRDHVFARIQEAPVIPVAGCEEKPGRLRAVLVYTNTRGRFQGCPGGEPRRPAVDPEPAEEAPNAFWRPRPVPLVEVAIIGLTRRGWGARHP